MSTAGGAPPPYGRPASDAYAQVPTPPPPAPFSSAGGSPHPYAADRAHRSARSLAIAVGVLLVVMAVLSLARVGAHANRASVMDDARPTAFDVVAGDEIRDADVLAGVAGLLFALGMLATGVVFIIWQHRHTTNAEALRGHRDGLGPGWAIGGWFIPVANLILPVVQVFGASRPSDPTLPPERGTRRGEGSVIVVLWGLVFGLASVFDRAGFMSYPDTVAETGGIDTFVSDSVFADQLIAVGSGLFVAAAIVAAGMVHQLTSRQDRRAATLTAAAQGQPGARRPPGGAWGPAGPMAPPPEPPPPPGTGAWSRPPGGPPVPPPRPGGPSPWAPPGRHL